MLGCPIAIGSPAEVSPLLFSGIKFLDEIEPRRPKLRL
jgi:hypothetical protein